MQLTQKQLSSIVFGAHESVYETDGVQFYRMPDELVNRFKKQDLSFYDTARATAGIYLDFYTDSEFFAFTYDDMQKSSSRTWCYFDLLINGKLVASVGEDTPTKTEYEFSTALPAGENRITLFFPNLYRARLTQIALSDGATIRRVQKKRRILFIGDSITHGYDTKRPSKSYANRISFQTDSEAVNLAVGGAFFDKDCIESLPNFSPDFIIVAYGTNDWRKKTAFACLADCQEFFNKLCSIYPDKPIYYVLPIRRYLYCDTNSLKKSFTLIRNAYKEIATEYPNVKIIDLWEAIPDDPSLYSDGLHPNEQGFAYYADGVIKQLHFKEN